MADGAYCACYVGTPNVGECPPCHASCSACSQGNNPNKCTSCAIATATLSVLSGGTCSCGSGYVPQSPAISACVECHSGCPYCVDDTEAGCMGSKDQAIFATNLATSFQLPLLNQANGLICYRQPVPDLNCNPLAIITGEIASDGDGLHFTLAQCYELLEIQWPFVSSWFGILFPNFTPPPSATEAEIYALKTVLQVWILQFGPSTLTFEWQLSITPH